MRQFQRVSVPSSEVSKVSRISQSHVSTKQQKSAIIVKRVAENSLNTAKFKQAKVEPSHGCRKCGKAFASVEGLKLHSEWC